MSTLFEVPFSAVPQKISIEMAGVSYQLTLKWCPASACWVLDIADDSSVAILTGIPLVTGADLFEQYGYLNFGGRLLAQTDHDLSAPPTFTNLGDTGHVYFEADV